MLQSVPGWISPSLEIVYTSCLVDYYVEPIVYPAAGLHASEPPRDFLIFVHDVNWMEKVAPLILRAIEDLGDAVGQVLICPLHGSMPFVE